MNYVERLVRLKLKEAFPTKRPATSGNTKNHTPLDRGVV
jgi:hypothetical protein